MEADKIKMLQARIPEKEKQVKQLKPDKKELNKIEQQVKVTFNRFFTVTTIFNKNKNHTFCSSNFGCGQKVGYN